MKKKCKMSSFCFIRGLALLLPLTIGIGSAIAGDTDPVATDDWKINSQITPTPTESIRLPSIDNSCMEDVSSQNGISGLQCTANDIRIADVFDIEISNGDPDPTDEKDECTIGEDVTFTAKFQFELSAQERHDLGVWFATAGQANARTGACLVSTAPIFIDENGNYLNDLDGDTTGVCSESTTQKCASDNECKGKSNICIPHPDFCGDIDDATSPQYFELEITTECVDRNFDQELDLPVCLSWRQPGADEYCEKATDAYPGAPSKCNCDDDFSVPITVPAPPLTVYKNISPATITEPGGDATVTFDIVNPSLYGNDVSISSITDYLDDYVTDRVDDSDDVINVDDADFDSPDDTLNVLNISDLICKQYPESYTSTPSSTPTSFDPSNDLLMAQEDQTQDPTVKTPNFVRCTFTREVGGEITGADTGWFFDLIKVIGVDEYNSPTEGKDDAGLQVVDKPPLVNLTKTVDPTTLTEEQIYNGLKVEYKVTVSVPLTSDTVTIGCLDEKTSTAGVVGTYDCGTATDITAVCLTAGGESLLGKTIAPGGSETCTFVAAATGISNTGEVLHDRVVVKVSDDEGGDASASDIASVTVTNSPPTLELTKTGAPTIAGQDKEPSYLATYTYVIKNVTLFDDIVVLDKLEDDITLVDGTILATKDITSYCKDSGGDTLLTANSGNPVELEKDDVFTCTLDRTVGLDVNNKPAGDAPGAGSDPGNTEDNEATVTGHEKGIAGDITASDTASLGFKDALPSATVKKDVNMMTVVYKVTVSSTSNEPLDITALRDEINNTSVDITLPAYDPPTGYTACDLSGSFESGSFELKAQNDDLYSDYVCYFSRTFDTENSNSPITDTVTATAVDDEGNEVNPKPTAKAQVSWISNAP